MNLPPCCSSSRTLLGQAHELPLLLFPATRTSFHIFVARRREALAPHLRDTCSLFLPFWSLSSSHSFVTNQTNHLHIVLALIFFQVFIPFLFLKKKCRRTGMDGVWGNWGSSGPRSYTRKQHTRQAIRHLQVAPFSHIQHHLRSSQFNLASHKAFSTVTDSTTLRFLLRTQYIHANKDS